jgi:hypothetical protein
LKLAESNPIPRPTASFDITSQLYRTNITGGKLTTLTPHRATRGAQIATLEIIHPGYFENTNATALFTNATIHSGDIIDTPYTPTGDQPAPIELNITAPAASPYGTGYIQHIIISSATGYHSGQTIEKASITAASSPSTLTGTQYRGGAAWQWTFANNVTNTLIAQATLTQQTSQHTHALLVSIHDYNGSMTIRPTISTTDGNHLWTGEAIPITRNGILDLGKIPLAPWNQNGGMYAPINVNLYATGNGTVSIDYLTAAPALGGYIHAHPTDSTLQSGLQTNKTLYILPPYANTTQNNGGTTRTHYIIGAHPHVQPAYPYDNMTHIAAAFDCYTFGAHPNAELKVSAIYRPRHSNL